MPRVCGDAPVRDRVWDILLNLKQTRFRALNPETLSGTARLYTRGSGDALSGDIDCGGLFEVANPNNFVTSLSGGDAAFSAELIVSKGMGYRMADRENAGPGVLPMDAVFGPAQRVNCRIEESALWGNGTDMERLAVEIWTDAR